MSDYVKHRLIFFVAQDVDDSLKQTLAAHIEGLAGSQAWTVSPPEFIDRSDDVATQPIDSPDETVGGVLEIYSAMDAPLPPETDQQCLRDVERVVDFVSRFSLEYGVEFEFELNGSFVGAVEAGVPDRILKQGLLEEWHRHLEQV